MPVRYLFIATVSFILALAFLVIREYYILHTYAERLRIVQEQYYTYLDAVKQVLKKHNVEGGSRREEGEALNEMLDDDEMTIDSFMVINRSPEYLKESTVSYLKNQQLDTLINRINDHEWHNYTQQVVMGVHQPVLRNVLPKRTRRTSAAFSPAGWRTPKGKRLSLTGITFCLPIDQSKFWLSSVFGEPRKKPSGKWGFHMGIDMAAQRGTPIKAAAGGIVEQAGYASGYGNTIVISHDKLYKTRYAHLDIINVKVGQQVVQNQNIGAVGDTGFTRKIGKDASHLHFELYERGKQINPLYLLAIK